MSRSMTPFFFAVFLLGVSSLVTATKFTLIYEWPDKLDCKWPSEVTRIAALCDARLEPYSMAVYGTRIFFVIKQNDEIHSAKLMSLSTSSASPTPPKITPFPSWDMHEFGNCQKIEEPSGLAVDSVGRLWVLDEGSSKCNSKLLIIDLTNEDHTILIHKFPFHGWLYDLVLDETPNETFAYISKLGDRHIVVFNLERNESWIVETPGIRVSSIALSPKDQKPRQLYVGIDLDFTDEWNSKKLYLISVSPLRNGTRTAKPKLIAKLTGEPYRMVVDNHGTMYAGFFNNNSMHSWNGSQPFQEQRFFEVDGLDSFRPFTFALDQNETLWIMAFNENKAEKRIRLLKAAVGAERFRGPSDCILSDNTLICFYRDSIVLNHY